MRLGMVGSGNIAFRHLAALREAEEVEVVAHLSRTPARAEAAAAAFGGTGYDSLAAFLRGGRPDAVIVTVPPDQHGALELELIEAGVPFLVEKPLGIDRTPEAIAERLAGTTLVTAAGYNWRALDTLDAVRRQLAATPPRMVLGRFHVGTPSAPWWRHEAQSGGQMLEQACHLVDLARHLCGTGELLAAAGHHGALPGFEDGDVAGTSAALFRFGGLPGVVTAAAVLPHGPGAELRLICEGCEIAVTLSGIEIAGNGETRRIEARANTYAVQNRAFLDAVRSHAPEAVLCTYADALATHRLCLEAAGRIRQR